MIRSVPQIVSVTAVVIGVLLFVLTLFYVDFDETVESAKRLGFALPIILLPGTAWHLLRTWGWSVAFPDHARPAFTRLFRARLAADAIGSFTVRGLAGDPLKIFDENCRPIGPGIDIEKFTNGEDADSAPGPSIQAGQPVTWTYTVRNTGTTNLTGVAVADDRGVAVNCSGQTTLTPGASMTCTGIGVATLRRKLNSYKKLADRPNPRAHISDALAQSSAESQKS